MMRRTFGVLLLIPLLLLTAAFQNVDNTPTPEFNPDANISFPPAVYTLRGENFPIHGTANVDSMANFFLEVRMLNDDLTPLDTEVLWLPITMPSNAPVVEDELGVWDTSLLEDGLYELRLVVILTGGERVEAWVTPLRIENEIPPFLDLGIEQPVVQPTSESVIVIPPATQAPVTSSPQAQASVSANVRLGDSTAYGIVTSLAAGQSVPVVGRSITGTGWWLVELPDGRRGWVAPTTVQVTGNTDNVPAVSPPPVPVAPTATPVPVAQQPDAVLTNVRFDRDLVMGQNFQIFATVRNDGGVTLPDTTVACNFTPVNQIFSSPLGALAPGQQVDVVITARLDAGGNSNVTANCAVDLNNLIAEVNENNNYFNLTAYVAMQI